MRLAELICHSSAKLQAAQYSIEINDLCLHHSQVSAGSGFFALRGSKVNAEQFIKSALAAGAAIVFHDAAYKPDEQIASQCVALADMAEDMAIIANHFYQAAHKIKLLGVTGTDGKTSTSHFLAEALQLAGAQSGLIGTLGNGLFGSLQESANTTPDALTIAQQLAKISQAGGEYVAMEVSSHALVERRVYGLQFELAILTNLARDHMDFHKSTRAYMQAKAQLFRQGKRAVINGNDDFGAYLIQQTPDFNGCVYGFGKDLPRAERVLSAGNLLLDAHGMRFDVQFGRERAALQTALYGEFNAHNLLAVIASLLELGFDLPTAVALTCQVKAPAGRMQKLGTAATPTVLVDFAHTAQALQAALRAARAHTHGKLHVVFGCGGDRDKSKRAVMGDIAKQYADQVYVTSDNPRSENPETIMRDIVGTTLGLSVISNRQEAIATAINHAKPNDVVLIAGKGHERFQLIGTQKIKFNDAAYALDVLQEYSKRERKC